MAAADGRLTGRPVVAFAGDGCFLMTGQELATTISQLRSRARRSAER
jgi:thiamine pyrophosphate-dependent acetolactate synthase large subunit-like protein